MSIYRQMVIMWPFELDSSNYTVDFEDYLGNPTSVALPAGIYLPTLLAWANFSLLDEFAKAMNSAAGALGLTGTFAATREPDGTVRLSRTGGVSPADNLSIIWGTSTFPREYLGFDGVANTIISLLDQVSPFTMDHQWQPGKPEVHLDPELRRRIVTEDIAINGRPSRVVQSPGPFVMREAIWERIWAARMLQSRADDAAYAVPADLPTGDDGTWETMWEYLVSVSAGNPFNDNRVYFLTTNITPVAADLEGPYEVVLSESTPDMRGVEPSSFVSGLAAEQYDASLMFWWSTV